GLCSREINEDTTSCPADCFCPNGSCDFGENSISCLADCPVSCGDFFCDPGEDPFFCSDDCGGGGNCGNFFCDPGEDESTCPGDCFCGNGSCDPGEDSTCPGDCGCPLCTEPCSGVAECQALFEGLPQEFLDALVCQDGHCDGPATCPPDSLGTISCAGQADPNGYCSTIFGFLGSTQCNIADGCCQLPL